MAEPILMLALSPTMEQGAITRWHKKEGDPVSNGELLCEVETDKATMEYESVNQGTLLKILVPDGGRAKVGDPIAIVGSPGEDIGAFLTSLPLPPAGQAVPTASQASPISEPVAPLEPLRSGLRIKASPLARRLARERRLDLSGLAGSGPGGRVLKRDLEAQAASRPAPARAPFAAKPPAAVGAVEERIPVSGKRKIIAQRLSESKQAAPHYYLRIDVDAGPLMELRQRINRRLATEGKELKVSVNAALMKLSAEALKRHPAANSSWQGDHILRFGRADIGLAVAQEDGLITPIVRDCGAKGILAIERELADLIERARAGRLRPEEYTGAGFTLTNLGSMGVLEFSAIINPPGAAILAVGRIRKVPVVDENDRIGVREQMILTLSCDHRVLDGVEGAAFLTDLKAIIEDPLEYLYTLND